MRYFVDGPAANKGGNTKAVAAGDRQRQTELRWPSIAADRDSMGSKSVPEIRLPYGVDELDPSVVAHADDLNLIRCFVRGCSHFVRRPTQNRRGTACPDHGIYCPHSRNRSTYTYDDVRRNIIASPELFAQRIVGHPFKYESDRFGDARSLTLDELLDVYWDSSLQILDPAKARESHAVNYQLWRNTVFAEWMATLDGSTTKALHANLVAKQYEPMDNRFRQLVKADFHGSYVRIHWEDIGQLAIRCSPNCSSLATYLATKSANLSRAFIGLKTQLV